MGVLGAEIIFQLEYDGVYVLIVTEWLPKLRITIRITNGMITVAPLSTALKKRPPINAYMEKKP